MIALILSTLAGAALYRWRGGPAWLPAPRWLKVGACAAFLALPAFITGGIFGGSVIGFLVAFGAVSLGHGAYMDLGRTHPEKDHDRVGPYQEEPAFAWLRWIFRSGTIAGSRAVYETLALSVTGLAATLVPGAVLILLAGPVGLALALSGLLKGPAYWLGWRCTAGSRATEIGEWLTGAGMGLGVGAALAGVV